MPELRERGTEVPTNSSEPFRAACHPACIACRARAAGGLALAFQAEPDGAVAATFPCEPYFQGYPDRLHGGIIATLLDAAMTHCLFARRIRGYTAKLEIRFHQPVKLGKSATVRAALGDSRPPLYLLRSEVWQDGTRCASATASFYGEAAGAPETIPA